MKNFNLFLVASLLFASCGNNFDSNNKQEESVMGAAYEAIDMAAVAESSAPSSGLSKNVGYNTSDETKKGEKDGREIEGKQFNIKIPAKIRKIGNINITVDDYKKTRIELEKIIKSKNGYISSEYETNSTYYISNSIVIRVANKDFESMMENIAAIDGHINSKNVTAEDVTAQYIDIETRLNSKKEIEKRYISILQKATKVSDILEIEQKLGEIREEIEAKEGELKYLADQVDYSTINLSITQNYEYSPVDKPGFWGKTGYAFEKGWNGFLSFIVGVVYLWPLLLILGVGTYFLVRFIKKQSKK